MKKIQELPTAGQLEAELKRVRYRNRYWSVLKSTIGTLVTVAAGAVLAATLLFPALRIYGGSMTPTLVNGDIVLAVKGAEFDTGDIIAFYYNNKILIKRVIAGPGDWVDIDEDGNVSVNNQRIEEPYLEDRAKGECDIELPYQVPDQRLFVMGDHRSVSVDSRSAQVGCVAQEQVVGKITFRIWPILAAGRIR